MAQSSQRYSSNNELSKRDVFQEINAELLSGRPIAPPRQKTRPGYVYVIFLNLLLMTAAGLGIYTVYRLFREQGIQLTVGTGGIQSLELLLIEQDARQKEQELLEAQAEAARIGQELENILNDINQQVTIEFNLQISNLAASIEQELQGKTEREKADIQERYSNEITRIQSEAEAETLRRVDEATRIQESERLRVEAELRTLQNARQNQPAPPPDRVPSAPIYGDNGAAALFNTVDRQLKAEDFPNVERTLLAIENIYSREASAPLEKRNADLFLVTLIRDYMALSNNNRTLLEHNLALSNGALQIVEGRNQAIADFRELITEISLLAQRNPYDPQVAFKLQELQAENPDVFSFIEAYQRYLGANSIKEAEPLIRRADRSLARRDYSQAAVQYRDILIRYPALPEQEDLLKNYAQALSSLYEKGDSANINHQVVYLKAPEAYILDITETGAVLSLFPGVVLRPNTALDIFQLNREQARQLLPAGQLVISESKGGYALARLNSTNARIGDLVYLPR